MKFSENWLRHHVPTTASRDELAATLTAIGLATPRRTRVPLAQPSPPRRLGARAPLRAQASRNVRTYIDVRHATEVPVSDEVRRECRGRHQHAAWRSGRQRALPLRGRRSDPPARPQQLGVRNTTSGHLPRQVRRLDGPRDWKEMLASGKTRCLATTCYASNRRNSGVTPPSGACPGDKRGVPHSTRPHPMDEHLYKTAGHGTCCHGTTRLGGAS